MKFSIFLVIVFIAILFTIDSTKACEKDCRLGISDAIAKNYARETGPFFSKFSSNLTTNLYKGINVIKLAGSASIATSLKKDINTGIRATVNGLQATFTGNFKKLVLNSIFTQEPPFKGDCSDPFRVEQPEALPWPDEACEKMDYICGNPPSICHFLDSIVKPRITKNIKIDLENRFKSFVNALTFTVKDIAEMRGMTESRFKATLVTGCNKNIKTQLKIFITEFKRRFCRNNNCEQYDEEIKDVLLSFP